MKFGYNAVAQRRYKLFAEVLFDVCGWEAAPPSSRRFLWHCSNQVHTLFVFNC